MKIVKILTSTIILSAVIFPTQAAAAWWNPFTWSIFQKHTVSNVASSTPTGNHVASKKSSNLPTSAPDTKKKLLPASDPVQITKTQSIPVPAVAATPEPKISKSVPQTAAFLKATDESEIRAKFVTLITMLQSKNTSGIDQFVAPQSKKYFDNILTLAKSAPKEQVLSQNFSTAFTVILIRLVATSTTINIQQDGNLVARLITRDTSPNFAKVDPIKAQITVAPISQTIADVSVPYEGKVAFEIRFVNESGSWYIDPSYAPSLVDAEIEQNIQAQSIKSGKSHSELMESIIRVFFGDSSEFKYYAWVPLNKRGDLNPAQAKMNGLAVLSEGYSIQYPEHWTLERIAQSEFIWAPYSNDGMRPAIVITANLTPYTNDLDAYARDIVESLPKVKTDVSGEIKSSKITFLGQPAYKLAYKRLRTSNEGRTYTAQPNESLVFYRNGTVYLVEYRNGLLDFESTRPIVERTISTLKFGPPCTQDCRTDMYDNN